MRIISQDGAIDVAYENADLERKGTIISVWTLDNVYDSFASYSTEEKAMKAMERCRVEYGKYYRVNGGTNAFTGVAIHPGVFMYPKVFQFPADDEI